MVFFPILGLFTPSPRLSQVFFCLFMMFDGHYINNKSIPAGAKWIEDANFFNWAISAGSRSELLGLGDLQLRAQLALFPQPSWRESI